MKSVSLLGSTGSIGTQTLDVIRKNNDIKLEPLDDNFEMLCRKQLLDRFLSPNT